MSLIGTKAHAVFMYAFSVAMILGALVFVGNIGGVEDSVALGSAPYVGHAAIWVVVAAGALLFALILSADLEWAYRRVVPLSVALGLEALIGLALAASPWLLRFSWFVAWPHVLIGLVLIGVAAVTRRDGREARP